MPRAKLQEILNPIPFEVLEWKEIEEGGEKKFRVKGIFNRADEKNANNRIYPAKLLEREHQKLQERLAKQDESTFMQADHPSDGVSRIKETTGIMRSVHYDPATKKVIGEADIVSTSVGRDLQAIIRAGGKPGISARGYGSTTVGEHAGQKGDIVQEDYQLVTYDFVVGQSTRGAVITNFEEQARKLSGLTEDDMDLKDLKFEDLKTARPDLIKAIADSVKAEMTKTVEETVLAKTKEIENAFLLKLEYGSDGKIRKDGEEVKFVKTAGGRGGDRGDPDPAAHVTTEAQLKAAAEKLGFKVEKKSKKDKEDAVDGGDDEMDETKLREQAKKLGLSVVKGDATLESEVTKLKSQLTEVGNNFKTLSEKQEVLDAKNKSTEVTAYIIAEVAKVKTRFKNALSERLLKLDLKSTAEVDAKLPVEKAALEKAILEATGGVGIEMPQEEIGDGAVKKFKTKAGLELTESELRQRKLADIKDELVEA